MAAPRSSLTETATLPARPASAHPAYRARHSVAQQQAKRIADFEARVKPVLGRAVAEAIRTGCFSDSLVFLGTFLLNEAGVDTSLLDAAARPRDEPKLEAQADDLPKHEPSPPTGQQTKEEVLRLLRRAAEHVEGISGHGNQLAVQQAEEIKRLGDQLAEADMWSSEKSRAQKEEQKHTKAESFVELTQKWAASAEASTPSPAVRGCNGSKPAKVDSRTSRRSHRALRSSS